MIFAAAIMLMASTATGAEPRLALWSNLYLGMSKDEVEAAYPNKSVKLTPDCDAKLRFRFASGGLMSVTLFDAGITTSRQKWDNRAKCREVVFASLVSKYGTPTIGREDTKYQSYEIFQWVNNDVSMKLTANTENKDYYLSYSYVEKVPIAKPDAVDKL